MMQSEYVERDETTAGGFGGFPADVMEAPPVVAPDAAPAARSVLIVDDSRTVRHLYSFVLKAAGYEVLLAEDGEKGFELALRAAPDLLLVDMIMPGMNGVQMLKALRLAELDADRKPAPALLLTALENPPWPGPELFVRTVLDKGRLTPHDIVEAVRSQFSPAITH